MPRGRKKTTPLTEKIEITPEKKQESMFSMVIGTVLVALGILLFVSGVVMLVLFNLPPRESTKVVAPVILTQTSSTNLRSVTISGYSKSERVMIWVNDELVNKSLGVVEEAFSYDYSVDQEGDYKIEVASIEGFPIRYRSPKTEGVVVTVDWTAPSDSAFIKYTKEVDTKVFTVTGTVEPNATVVISKGSKEYSSKANSKGDFRIKNVPLSLGKNDFSVSVKDSAGNVTKLSKVISVKYLVGDLNGNGASTSLPVSAGSLDGAKAFLLGNSLMTMFGAIALAAFVTSSGVVLYRSRRELV